MAVFRLLIAGILLSRELSRRETPPAATPYDPFALASRPLPAGLRIYRHPREIRAERVREITGGRMA